jgi:crotonobetainyl-CoA:carnitine CoA-transferase CaiB-like acyl-CoA transferase
MPYLSFRYGGVNQGRPGLRHPTIAPYGAFNCSDGKLILIAVQNEREWERFCCEILEAPAMAKDELFSSNVARVENRGRLDDRIAAVFARIAREELVARLERAHIAYSHLSTLEDLAGHPQARSVRIVLQTDFIDVLAPPLGEGRRSDHGQVPELGSHDAIVRSEFARADILPIILQRGDALTAQAVYRNSVAGHPKIDIRYQTTVEEISGDRTVTGIRLRYT